MQKEGKYKCVSDKRDMFGWYHHLKITIRWHGRENQASSFGRQCTWKYSHENHPLHRRGDAGNADASISLGMPGTRGRDATILSRSPLRGSERLFELAERYAKVRHGKRHIYHSTHIHASTRGNIHMQVEHGIKITSDWETRDLIYEVSLSFIIFELREMFEIMLDRDSEK